MGGPGEPASILDHLTLHDLQLTIQVLPIRHHLVVLHLVKLKLNGYRCVLQSRKLFIARRVNNFDLDKTPEILVSKLAYKVFATLSRSTREDRGAAESPWLDFLHAMFSVCFSVEKLHGLAWVLAPRDDGFRRSIVFQEPRPCSITPFWMARRYGALCGLLGGARITL